jgi:hypothetical protein
VFSSSFLLETNMSKTLIGIGIVLLIVAATVYTTRESTTAQRKSEASSFDDRMNRGVASVFGGPRFDTESAVESADHMFSYFLAGSGVLCAALGLATFGREKGSHP